MHTLALLSSKTQPTVVPALPGTVLQNQAEALHCELSLAVVVV